MFPCLLQTTTASSAHAATMLVASPHHQKQTLPPWQTPIEWMKLGSNWASRFRHLTAIAFAIKQLLVHGRTPILWASAQLNQVWNRICALLRARLEWKTHPSATWECGKLITAPVLPTTKVYPSASGAERKMISTESMGQDWGTQNPQTWHH